MTKQTVQMFIDIQEKNKTLTTVNQCKAQVVELLALLLPDRSKKEIRDLFVTDSLYTIIDKAYDLGIDWAQNTKTDLPSPPPWIEPTRINPEESLNQSTSLNPQTSISLGDYVGLNNL